ncbi:MAG: zinc-ribbon domain-containing protein [Ruminococcus sp.]|nr:zinc-ribbon domain-containing protein [Ruminococcus sp.]
MYCKKCGAEQKPGAKFCLKCGTKVQPYVVPRTETTETHAKSTGGSGKGFRIAVMILLTLIIMAVAFFCGGIFRKTHR